MDEGYFRHIREYPDISIRDARIIRRHHATADRVVDLGYGRGGFLAICKGDLVNAIGVDSEPAAAAICRAQQLPFLLADVTALPFAPASLDVVRAKEVIEHLADARQMLWEVYRVLRPNGLFRPLR